MRLDGREIVLGVTGSIAAYKAVLLLRELTSLGAGVTVCLSEHARHFVGPLTFRTLSAFAPICAPIHCPWGSKALYGYLGDDFERWKRHDASALMRRQSSVPFPDGILVDQGLSDKFLATQLLPERLEAACESVGQPLALRRHDGYDHGYYFISTFIEDHLRFHVERLSK